MGSIFSKVDKEAEQRRTVELIKIENEPKVKEREHKKETDVKAGAEKAKRETQMLEIVKRKMEMEVELKKYTFDKGVELASNMQQNGQGVEDFRLVLEGIVNVSEKKQIKTEIMPSNQGFLKYM